MVHGPTPEDGRIATSTDLQQRIGELLSVGYVHQPGRPYVEDAQTGELLPFSSVRTMSDAEFQALIGRRRSS